MKMDLDVLKNPKYQWPNLDRARYLELKIRAETGIGATGVSGH